MIPMLQSSDNIKILCGKGDFEAMKSIKRLPPFSDIACDFLNELSSELLHNAEAKTFPDVVTFGFFCRKGNIQRLRADYGDSLSNRLGRGVSFHIAPSNVPINFAYSMVSAFLAGNACIVRASSKEFRQIDIVCSCMNKVMEKECFSLLADYLCVVKYPHSSGITDNFSSFADIRVIWGGDSTIEDIRKSPIPPRSVEISFADRYSAAVFSAKEMLKCSSLEKLAQDFYNDTYLYDQNACSSPRLIYWLGEADEAEKAMTAFWNAVHELIMKKYKVEPVIAVDKYTASCRAAIDLGADITEVPDNLINRIRLHRLDDRIYDYRCPGGSFFEYVDTKPDALADIITPKYQTISVFGVDGKELSELIIQKGLSGVDRIVPVGKTADFSLIWDGYDLIAQMSRIISF